MTDAVQTVARALTRFGGAIVAPRRTVAALPEDEGRRDGLALGVAYVLGTSVYSMVAAIATVYATHSVVALASGVARVVLTPIVVLVLTETLLGGARSHRSGVTLLPLVLVGTLAHLFAKLGLASLSGLWPDVVGAGAAAAYALWIRSAVSPHSQARRGDA